MYLRFFLVLMAAWETGVVAQPVMAGYDVVEYFNLNDGDEGVVGSPWISYDFHYGSLGLSAEFWFSTEENKTLFINDPWKYAPKWGGFCSWGIAQELPPSWPWAVDFLGPPCGPRRAWDVYNQSLYCNYFESIAEMFFSDAENNLRLAEERWIGWFGTLLDGPFNTGCIDSAACVWDPQYTGPQELQEEEQESETQGEQESEHDNELHSQGDEHEGNGKEENEETAENNNLHESTHGQAEDAPNTEVSPFTQDAPNTEDESDEEHSDADEEQDENNAHHDAQGDVQDCYIKLSEEYEIFWEFDEDVTAISFTINVDLNKAQVGLDSWIAFAISPDGTMWGRYASDSVERTDAVIRIMNTIDEYDIFGYGEEDIVREIHLNQDLTAKSMQQNDGIVTVKFTRPIETESDRTIRLDGPTYIVWAYGNTRQLQYHVWRDMAAISFASCLPPEEIPRFCANSDLAEELQTSVDELMLKILMLEEGVEELLRRVEDISDTNNRCQQELDETTNFGKQTGESSDFTQEGIADWVIAVMAICGCVVICLGMYVWIRVRNNKFVKMDDEVEMQEQNTEIR